MKLTLKTTAQDEAATCGELRTESGWLLCLTLEEPYRLNQKDVSCIPAGKYSWFKRLSPKRGYEVIELKDVPGRTNVQIHVGNFLKDTEGCVLVGTQRSDEGAPPSIHESKLAFRLLMAAVAENATGTLEVIR